MEEEGRVAPALTLIRLASPPLCTFLSTALSPKQPAHCSVAPTPALTGSPRHPHTVLSHPSQPSPAALATTPVLPRPSQLSALEFQFTLDAVQLAHDPPGCIQGTGA